MNDRSFLKVQNFGKMTELSFARSFLASLDSRPTRLSAEHVEDPRSYPARGAVRISSFPLEDAALTASQYILPKMPRPMAKRQKLTPGQERSLTISLKSLRNPPLDIILKSQSLLTSILDLKTEVSSQSSIPVDKIRILHKKKPVGDAKVLKDLVGEEETSVEFSIMVMGGAASVKREGDAVATAPVAQGSSGSEILWADEFWEDLKGFLTQRLKDQGEGERVYGLFRNAWEASGAA